MLNIEQDKGFCRMIIDWISEQLEIPFSRLTPQAVMELNRSRFVIKVRICSVGNHLYR